MTNAKIESKITQNYLLTADYKNFQSIALFFSLIVRQQAQKLL